MNADDCIKITCTRIVDLLININLDHIEAFSQFYWIESWIYVSYSLARQLNTKLKAFWIYSNFKLTEREKKSLFNLYKDYIFIFLIKKSNSI